MFKIPLFQNIQELQQLVDWFRELYSRLAGGNLIKDIVVDIGDWNLVSTPFVTVPYKQSIADINYKRVLSVSIQIYKDDLTDVYFETGGQGAQITAKVDSTTNSVTLTRVGSGFYDSTDFDLTSAGDPTFTTRGKVKLCLTT